MGRHKGDVFTEREFDEIVELNSYEQKTMEEFPTTLDAFRRSPM